MSLKEQEQRQTSDSENLSRKRGDCEIAHLNSRISHNVVYIDIKFTAFLSDLPQSNPLGKKDPWLHLVKTKASFPKGFGCSKIKPALNSPMVARYTKGSPTAHPSPWDQFISSQPELTKMFENTEIFGGNPHISQGAWPWDPGTNRVQLLPQSRPRYRRGSKKY